MAHSLSARKRIRQNINRWRKRRIHDALREYDELILHGSVDAAEQALQGLYKLLDQVAATSAIHKNQASRTKSRLAARLNRKKETASAA